MGQRLEGRYHTRILSATTSSLDSCPGRVTLEGVGFGFLIGGQTTEFVLAAMNERGAKSILSSKSKIGVIEAPSTGRETRTCARSEARSDCPVLYDRGWTAGRQCWKLAQGSPIE